MGYLALGGPPVPGPIRHWIGLHAVPLPVFPAGAAVPTDNIDVMVFRHTPHPAAAAALALGLFAAPLQ